MKNILTVLLLSLSLNTFSQEYTILLHGGAGNGIKPENFSAERQTEYEAKMTEALQAGQQILENEGTALETVVAVIKVLEDSPLFNAGKGAVFTWDETNEMDASIMNGADLSAGAVAGVSVVKNPVTAALAVLENSPHVMLSGSGADDFAKRQNLEIVSPEYFKTEKSLQSLQRFKKLQGTVFQNDTSDFHQNKDWKFGTVGCVVLDKNGNLAAGTSTGGMTGKRFGRIGDSPVIGAGTYADNEGAAVSCTGHGEYFIRHTVAYNLNARMKFGGQTLEEAAEEIIHQELSPQAGSGGLIAIDKNGNITMEFNTSGMFRAYLKEGQKPVVQMFAE